MQNEENYLSAYMLIAVGFGF